MKIPTMIYKLGGSFKVGKKLFSTKVIDSHEVEDYEKDGWRCSPQEAKECAEKVVEDTVKEVPKEKPKSKKTSK